MERVITLDDGILAVGAGAFKVVPVPVVAPGAAARLRGHAEGPEYPPLDRAPVERFAGACGAGYWVGAPYAASRRVTVLDASTPRRLRILRAHVLVWYIVHSGAPAPRVTVYLGETALWTMILGYGVSAPGGIVLPFPDVVRTPVDGDLRQSLDLACEDCYSSSPAWNTTVSAYAWGEYSAA